ncbi:unnamed protein product [Macrosiphum euphorbiae]|uniref:DUF4806 domain-containing protein n=1 Tax=Macrosiphum euphorbiae TaxID=13131 RepID=A0AAV0XGC6_9HEMI|nr:unnamed protein product [Macrosiphum euphorbiae]
MQKSGCKISLAIKSYLKPSKNSKEWKYCEVKVLSKKLLTNFNEASKLTNKFLTQSSTEAESYLPKKFLKKTVAAAAIAMKVIQAFHYYHHFQKLMTKYKQLMLMNVFQLMMYVKKNTVNNLFTLDINSSTEEKTGNTDNDSVLENLLADDYNWINNVSMINNNCDNNEDNIIILNSSVQIENNDVKADSVETINPNWIQEDPAVQKQIIRQLVTLNARSKEHGEYLHTIMMILNDMQERQKISTDQLSATSSSSHEFEKIYETLPVSSEESLNILQNALTNNDTLYNKTVKMLSLIGGGDVKDYTGHKNSKNAFNKTILSSLLIKAIHSSVHLADKSIKEIETIASIWLSKTGERSKNRN